MLKKYTIEYSVHFRKHSPPAHHQYFSQVAARMVCTTLHIKPDEERYRFGFAA